MKWWKRPSRLSKAFMRRLAYNYLVNRGHSRRMSPGFAMREDFRPAWNLTVLEQEYGQL